MIPKARYFSCSAHNTYRGRYFWPLVFVMLFQIDMWKWSMYFICVWKHKFYVCEKWKIWKMCKHNTKNDTFYVLLPRIGHVKRIRFSAVSRLEDLTIPCSEPFRSFRTFYDRRVKNTRLVPYYCPWKTQRHKTKSENKYENLINAKCSRGY